MLLDDLHIPAGGSTGAEEALRPTQGVQVGHFGKLSQATFWKAIIAAARPLEGMICIVGLCSSIARCSSCS